MYQLEYMEYIVNQLLIICLHGHFNNISHSILKHYFSKILSMFKDRKSE